MEWIWVPSGYVKIAIEHDHRKFVDFPINSGFSQLGEDSMEWIPGKTIGKW